MAVSSNSRRRRYSPTPPSIPLSLTPKKVALLSYLSDAGVASLPQIARVMEAAPQATRRHLRLLFDAGLVQVHPVGRLALAEPGAPNDESLLYGSAPNVYSLSRQGCRVLKDLGLGEGVITPVSYGPLNSLFLRHRLAIEDVRIWLILSARRYPGHGLECWKSGPEAAIDLKRQQAPRAVIPDAWFIYRLQKQALIGILELDRNTERGSLRWKQKLAAYSLLFASGRLKELTGYANARVLVVTPSERRRDYLTRFIAEQAPSSVNARFWLVDDSLLEAPTLSGAIWRRPVDEIRHPLVPPELLLAQA